MLTGYFNEDWTLVSRSSDPETGFALAIVRRVKHDVIDRATTWRLVQRANGWYNTGQWINLPNQPSGLRTTPERFGVKLSGSRIDLTLLSFAQEGHPHVFS